MDDAVSNVFGRGLMVFIGRLMKFQTVDPY